MSFERFKFIFNPPKTVFTPTEEIAAAASAQAATALATDPALQQRSASAQLAVKLGEMVDTSQYLQQVVLNRVQGRGVAIDLNVDPDTARSLLQIYGSDPPPPVVTMAMYAHLLDAEIGAVRLELVLGEGSTVEPNIFQAADLARVTSTVEDHLLASASFQDHIAMLLRQLKGDEIIFQHWRDQLAQYPAYNQQFNRTTLEKVRDTSNTDQNLLSANDIDISPALAGYINKSADQSASIYSSTYKLLSQPSTVEQDLPAVASTFFDHSIPDLIRLIGSLESLRSLTLKPRLGDSADDLSQFVYVRLLGDTGAHAFELDRLLQMITGPLQSMTGPIGTLLGTIQSRVGDVGRILGGGLRGGVQGGIVSGLPHNPISTVSILDDGLPASVRSLGQHLDWAGTETTRAQAIVQESFRKMSERRSNAQGDRLNLLSSLQSVESLINLAKGFVSQAKQGALVPSSNSAQRLETIGRILSTLRSSNASSLVIQDDQVIVTPPDMPIVPPAVEKVLRRGGLDRVLGKDLRVIKVIQ